MQLPAEFDTHAYARLNNALARDRWTNAADRETAARLEEISPGCGDLVTQARLFARRTVRHAITKGCRGSLVCGAGLAAPPYPHTTADGRVLPGRHVLADPDPTGEITLINRAETVGRPETVSCIQGTAAAAGPLLDAWQVRRVGMPLCAVLQWGPTCWPPHLAEHIVLRWAKLLEPGSVLALTWWIPHATVQGREWARAAAGSCGPVYRHDLPTMENWMTRGLLDVREARSQVSAGGGVSIAAVRGVIPAVSGRGASGD